MLTPPRLVALAWATAIGLWGGTAVAALVPVRVSYQAPSDCGSAESFAAELFARHPGARHAWPGETAFELAISLQVTAQDVVGSLVLTDPIGTRTVRVVPGHDCPDVVSALALVAAILTRAANSPRMIASPSVPTDPTVAGKRRSAPGNVWMGGGAAIGVYGGVAPGLSLGPSFELVGAFEAPGVLSPWASVGLHHASSPMTTAPNGKAAFDWTAGRIAGCPLRWPHPSRVSLRPCALFEMGKLLAAGQGTTENPDSAEVTWYAAGVLLRLEVWLLKPLAIVAEGTAIAPLLRDSFYFEPKTPENEVFRVPPWAMSARFGLAARLW